MASTTAFRDVWEGACAAARWVVTVSGIAAIGVAALVLGHEDLRASIASAMPFSSVAPVVLSEPVVVADETIAPARPTIAADPRQKHVVQYLSRRYRVADGAVRMLVSAAFEIGREKNLDPLLILSVVAIESSLNPFAESAVGAQGLMQVMTRVHSERFVAHGGEMAALDPIANMKVGSEILRDVISRGGSIERGLQLYVGAGNMPDDGGYGARVLGERARLQMAAAGKVDAAIAAGRAPPAPAPESKPATAQAVPPAAASTGEATT
ncbi:MAG: transglycosylase SLT domain-containing protein [Bradyrhizobium sp.]